ncbi:hypothetical protein R3P38DRAFT_3197363 [Favolaschia claudopus]|uniref:Endonuclease/exonuclease/phosphatase domain-containing protein n=1 Tax=Favolaschia claudopus TaxID=2862362 RepID=A0AAW0B608_9AGAR
MTTQIGDIVLFNAYLLPESSDWTCDLERDPCLALAAAIATAYSGGFRIVLMGDLNARTGSGMPSVHDPIRNSKDSSKYFDRFEFQAVMPAFAERLGRLTGMWSEVARFLSKKKNSTVNKHLVSLSLPSVLYATKQNDSSIFLVPASAADTQVLDKEWSRWGPTIFPGNMRELKREFELRNPDLGPVTGLPTWVNRPPSEAQAAAISASGRKPKLAGSVYFLLQSRDKVDLALSRGRIDLSVLGLLQVRSYEGPMQRQDTVLCCMCQACWRPLTNDAVFRARRMPCGGKHRADSHSCPKRKELLVTLAGRMKDLHESLDKSSIHPLPFIQQHAH